MKRVWNKVETTNHTGVTLDGRPVRTPGRRALSLPTPALTDAVAQEWDSMAKGEEVDPTAMPLTQLASTALDRVAPQREEIITTLLRYAETDLVCYRTEEPPELAQRQRASWQPLLDWLDRRYGVRLNVAEGVIHAPQDPAMLERLADIVRGFDDWRLTALQAATAATGSIVVALALVAGRIGAAQAFSVAELDESFQIERWGEDPIARARREGVASDLDAARRFLDLLGDAPAGIGRS
ncbi:ATP12 family chaperone protein [Roseiterribacter gracilis]|uniref:ATPase n=1 Tax=Roseiterribacter gracilis TaxID=2812848 RepID=A0A8S8X7V3_9PROT|nr:ATPase [Rhodospirillales bacterium TMPK1]